MKMNTTTTRSKLQVSGSRMVYVHRLGCPKLDVDQEYLNNGLKNRGITFVTEPEAADTLIVSTCAFIGDARKEAVESILEGIEWKKEVSGRRIFVSGCLPVRYESELAVELPEVDGWYGFGKWQQALDHITSLSSVAITPSKSQSDQTKIPSSLESTLSRLPRSTSSPYAYLKIAEGCNRRCSYCAIPSIRGAYRSRSVSDIINECHTLIESGTSEIIVIAQEINSYGNDLDGKDSINSLLPLIGEQFDKLGKQGWLRILYTHPPLFDDAFIDSLRNTPHLVPYIDFPIEHADNSVLRAMRRATTWEKMSDWIDKLRTNIPEIALRTSVIVGHPGEGEGEFETLLQRLEETKFDHIGVFQYSPEEGTHAETLKQIPQEIRAAREDQLQELIYDQAEERAEGLLNKQVEVLLEEYNETEKVWTGRSIWDAPDIDWQVTFDGVGKKGELIEGRIIAAEPWHLSVVPA
ncbi:30S ribosomal protein S12 methylthiotransferase RimO [bacterium]|nr:30S ribosomal protein S12 methylthiotransferase RimO [bacterium]